MSFKRRLDLKAEVARKSILLVGPRQTGKSTLIRATWPEALFFDLLDRQTFRTLASNPSFLDDTLRQHPRTPLVVIDEIQKLPELLDDVHRLVEAHKSLRFVLTGSSVRKLRRGGVNLLGGRMRLCDLHPITSCELASDIDVALDLASLLRVGGLPSILTSDQPERDLADYVGAYLQEEIQAEGLIRSIGNFSRFLDTAAATNGEQVIFSSVANDAQIPARTVRDYYQVLEDTLVGELLPGFRTDKRKAMAAAKFYFFDVGVANSLLGRFNASKGSPEFGRTLEHLVFCELKAAQSYLDHTTKLFYWRSLSQIEVDFVLRLPRDRFVGIEVKGRGAVTRKDCKGLLALQEDRPRLRKIVVCMEKHARRTEDGVEILPLAEFLRLLWDGALFAG